MEGLWRGCGGAVGGLWRGNIIPFQYPEGYGTKRLFGEGGRGFQVYFMMVSVLVQTYTNVHVPDNNYYSVYLHVHAIVVCEQYTV